MSDAPPLLPEADVREWIDANVPAGDFAGKRLLLVVPDATRTAPLPLLFDALYAKLRPAVAELDVMVALGTHRPMSEAEMCRLLGITQDERGKLFAATKLLNHAWDDDDQLKQIGVLSQSEVEEITEGRLSLEVPVRINRTAVEDYDALLVVGPVFPHEVVGFSGGNKYFFPGISGPEVLNFFHWLGALITNVGIIGTKSTPVRTVVDRAAAMIPIHRKALTFVVGVGTESLHALAYGSPEEAWSEAADVSGRVHIKRTGRTYRRVIACVPGMYDELWVAGKGMYKLEPVVEDGGELVIYAPHLAEVSVTHGETIRRLGYHCRDYFVKQWERFKDEPWGTLAHSTHVRGQGTFEGGVENCRIKVTVASELPREELEAINLGWADWRAIDLDAESAAEDTLVVRKAGEQLYRP